MTYDPKWAISTRQIKTDALREYQMVNLVRNDSINNVKGHLISINYKIPKLNIDCLYNMHWLQKQLMSSDLFHKKRNVWI